MGQKTHPIGLRLGINRTWSSNWFDESNFADKLIQDVEIRKYILSRKAYQNAGIARIDIERQSQNVVLTLHTARPGMVIGRKGQDVERLRQELNHKFKTQVQVNIIEIKKPELVAKLVADAVARQLEGSRVVPSRNEEDPAGHHAQWRRWHQDHVQRPSGRT